MLHQDSTPRQLSQGCNLGVYQLVGLEVVTTMGERLGTLSDVMETGANDVYVVDNGGQEILLPAIAEVVKAIDMETGRMVVEVIEGLI